MDITDKYKQQALLAGQEADKYKQLANNYSLMRLGIFAGMAMGVYFGVVADDFTIIAVAFVLLVFCFAWLVSRQSDYEQQMKYYQGLKLVHENEIANMANRANLYNDGSSFADEKHFYSADLDIFGKASLFHFINRAATSLGNSMLAAWLRAPARKETVLQRQSAVVEIAGKDQWKPELQTLLLFANNEDVNQLKRLFAYLHLPLNVPGEKALVAYIKVAPFLLTGAIIASIFLPIFNLATLLFAATNITITVFKGSYIMKGSSVADNISKVLAGYAAVFDKIEKEDWKAPYTNGLTQKLKDEHTSESIKELSKLINKLSYNLIMIVGFILNVFFLWALKQIIAIENWKQKNAANLEDAFEVIAEFEALSSLAGLHINCPEWAIPQIEDADTYTIIAKDLAHPLIDKTKRVENDYELTDTYKIDIITGSNMAGKSTFLRTIGINSVLALCGAPVCASAMTVSVMTMVSYMRIKDSLNESTSTFKAELDRLQMLLATVESDTKVFFLIDEMLRGTNSVDKYLGSKAVIEQLIRKKGVGLVATHDLQIAQLETKYPDYVRNFYFDIQVKDGEMLFDYKIKHGECKTFNATLLLKQIGIDVSSS